MEDILTQLGLNPKEAQFYLFLLQEGSKTASEIAKQLKESRTNTYMVLDKLETEKLVTADDTSPVRRYSAVDPALLRNRLNTELQNLKQRQSLLQTALPELSSLYSLGQHKPGVVYLEGIAGFKALLEDNARLSSGTIDLIASDEAMDNKEAWELLQKGAVKRSARGVVTRGIFHVSSDKHWQRVKRWENKGYQARRWGDQPLAGEIVIYGNKVAFTVYQPALIVTVVTDAVLAQTFRVIFEQLWQQAKP